MPRDWKFHAFLWGLVIAVFAWSGWRPADRFTWVMEVFPVIVGTVILLAVYSRWTFSRLVRWLLAAHAIGARGTPAGKTRRGTSHLQSCLERASA